MIEDPVKVALEAQKSAELAAQRIMDHMHECEKRYEHIESFMIRIDGRAKGYFILMGTVLIGVITASIGVWIK